MLVWPRRFVLLEPQVIDGHQVPAGFISDGLSVPKPLRILFDPLGVSVLPAVLHDYLVRYRVGLDARGQLVASGLSRRECDARFRRAAARINGMPDYAALLWIAVRVGGWIPWRNHRRRDRTGVNDYRTAGSEH